jgi:hypothetical protein
MSDWYDTHDASPACYSDAEYLNWAQDAGVHVDVAGNVTWPGCDPGDALLVPIEVETPEGW